LQEIDVASDISEDETAHSLLTMGLIENLWITRKVTREDQADHYISY